MNQPFAISRLLGWLEVVVQPPLLQGGDEGEDVGCGQPKSPQPMADGEIVLIGEARHADSD